MYTVVIIKGDTSATVWPDKRTSVYQLGTTIHPNKAKMWKSADGARRWADRWFYKNRTGGACKVIKMGDNGDIGWNAEQA
jgi:hypothetical protein